MAEWLRGEPRRLSHPGSTPGWASYVTLFVVRSARVVMGVQQIYYIGEKAAYEAPRQRLARPVGGLSKS